MKATKVLGSLLVAIFIAGCSSPREDRSQRLSEEAWRAFEAAGHKGNRLLLDNNAPLSPETSAQLGILVVTATSNAPGLQAQRPLTGRKAAWRGAKLWLGWETSEPARRLPRGRPKAQTEAQPSFWKELVGSKSGRGGAAPGMGGVVMGYLMYAPVGGSIGAIWGAAGSPSETEVQQALGVLSNTVAAVRTHQLLASEVLKQLRRCERSVTSRPELVISNEVSAGDSTLEVNLAALLIEGGAKPNPKLWLTLRWCVSLRRAGVPEPDYSACGVWQSDKQHNLQKWATDGGVPLRAAIEEACGQIAAAAVEQLAPCKQ